MLQVPGIRPTTILFYFLLVAWALIAMLGYFRMSALVEQTKLVEKTNEVIITIEQTFSQAKDMETSQRGFLLTGDSAFLESFFVMRPGLDRMFSKLQGLTFDNAGQQERLIRLKKKLNLRLDILTHGLDYRSRLGKNPPIEVLQQGRMTMDSVRLEIDKIKSEELRLLDLRKNEKEELVSITPKFMLLLSFFSLALLVWLFMLQRNEILKRKEHATELRSRADELEFKNKELEQFNYVSSHHLQEPLRKIEMFSDLVESNDARHAVNARDYLSRIRISAGKLRKLIDDLNNYTGLIVRTGNYIERVNLDWLVLRFMKKQVDGGNNISFRKDPLPEINADQNQLNLLFSNILENAIKFAEPSRPLEIDIRYNLVDGAEVPGIRDWQADNKFHKVSISDNGMGFNNDYAARIFIIFEKVHHTNLSSSGIGLALCKKIVERHRGYITASGIEGVGSCFDIFLPQLQEEA